MKFNKSLFEPTDNLIMAFSGGSDSVACLHYVSGIHDVKKISAFYLHHGLREEAEQEVEFCRDFCKKLDITFYSDKIDIYKLAKQQKKSLEQMGREVRYQKLAELAQDLRDKNNKAKVKLVTGHHSDDQTESVLLQIFSGTGGLRIGIAEQNTIFGEEVIRPLLKETKENILNYCQEKHLPFVTDESNLQNDFKRNKLRNVIIPMIRKMINPSLEKAIERFKNISDEMSEYLDNRLDEINKEITDGSGCNLVLFMQLHPFLQKEFLKKELIMKLVIVTNGLLEQLLEQLKSEKPNLEYLINNQIKLVKYYDYFQITEITNNSDVYTHLGCGENFVGDRKIVVYLDTMCVVDKQKKFSVCLDADKVNLDSLIVRGRQASDAFIPLGMKGKKKLKDYFIDKKIPKFERDSVLLIEHDGGIIWVVGHEIDDRYKVTKDTKSFLVIEATPK